MADNKRKTRLRRDYAWLLSLAASDPSVARFAKQAEAKLIQYKGDPTSFTTWFDRAWPAVEWAKKRTSQQQQAEIESRDPRFAADFQASMDKRKQEVDAVAKAAGVTLDADELDFLAKEARFNDWDQTTIAQKLRPYLEADLASGEDLRGTAGDNQMMLSEWAAENGLDLPPAAAAGFLARATTGEQSMDDVKAEIRNTYFAGMYPAWADQFSRGLDPSQVFAPYLGVGSKTLEAPELGLDDPVMKRITQSVGADGKPTMVPLYQAEQLFRQDPRWQKTDNAYSSYAGVPQNILRTWGFA